MQCPCPVAGIGSRRIRGKNIEFGGGGDGGLGRGWFTFVFCCSGYFSVTHVHFKTVILFELCRGMLQVLWVLPFS